MSLYFSANQQLILSPFLNKKFMLSPWFRYQEQSRVNYQAMVSPEYEVNTAREKLRVAGVLALVETFNFPLQRIAINVSLPTNKRKKATVVVYRDDARREPQLVLERHNASLSLHQRELALAQTIRKAQALGAPWAMCAIGETSVLVAKAIDSPTVVELPFNLLNGIVENNQ